MLTIQTIRNYIATSLFILFVPSLAEAITPLPFMFKWNSVEENFKNRLHITIKEHWIGVEPIMVSPVVEGMEDSQRARELLAQIEQLSPQLFLFLQAIPWRKNNQQLINLLSLLLSNPSFMNIVGVATAVKDYSGEGKIGPERNLYVSFLQWLSQIPATHSNQIMGFFRNGTIAHETLMLILNSGHFPNLFIQFPQGPLTAPDHLTALIGSLSTLLSINGLDHEKLLSFLNIILQHPIPAVVHFLNILNSSEQIPQIVNLPWCLSASEALMLAQSPTQAVNMGNLMVSIGNDFLKSPVGRMLLPLLIAMPVLLGFNSQQTAFLISEASNLIRDYHSDGPIERVVIILVLLNNLKLTELGALIVPTYTNFTHTVFTNHELYNSLITQWDLDNPTIHQTFSVDGTDLLAILLDISIHHPTLLSVIFHTAAPSSDINSKSLIRFLETHTQKWNHFTDFFSVLVYLIMHPAQHPAIYDQLANLASIESQLAQLNMIVSLLLLEPSVDIIHPPVPENQYPALFNYLYIFYQAINGAHPRWIRRIMHLLIKHIPALQTAQSKEEVESILLNYFFTHKLNSITSADKR